MLMNLNEALHGTPLPGSAAASRGVVSHANRPGPDDFLGDLARGAGDQRRIDDRLHEAARRIADEARSDDLQAEEMLVRVKKQWANVAEIRRSTPDDGLGEVQARLITECIRAFYVDDQGDTEPGRTP